MASVYSEGTLAVASLIFANRSDRCKKQGLRDKDGKKITRYHYLFFIATVAEARGQGLASKMVAKYQQKGDGLPIWLEATTKKSRDIYERCGFKEIQEMKVGVGTHASTGVFENGKLQHDESSPVD